MFSITIPGEESFDDEKSEFIVGEGTKIELEHSLFTLSKWESKWEKPFLSEEPQSHEESYDYFLTMIVGEIPPEEVLERLTEENLKQVHDFIHAKMTATWFGAEKSPTSKEIITSEVIYYWMIAFQIPFECEHWHLNRLLTLIKVCNDKNKPQEKKPMTKGDLAARRALNEKRRAEMNSSG